MDNFRDSKLDKSRSVLYKPRDALYKMLGDLPKEAALFLGKAPILFADVGQTNVSALVSVEAFR